MKLEGLSLPFSFIEVRLLNASPLLYYNKIV
jgi:hypothetical protein